MSECLIYKIECQISGRAYIGVTRIGLDKRWRSHVSSAGKGRTIFSRAIRKYGPDAFSLSVLYVAVDEREANVVERGLIAEHGTLVPNGYNLSTGGSLGARHSAETKAKLSEKSKGRQPSRKAIERSVLARAGKPLAAASRRGLMIGWARSIAQTAHLTPEEAAERRRKLANNYSKKRFARIAVAAGREPGKVGHPRLYTPEEAAERRRESHRKYDQKIRDAKQ